MKNSDLSNAIGNVNLKYIEEMENYTSKRMSLTKIVSLASCIAILVTAIPLSLILNREAPNESTPIITTPNKTEMKDPDNLESKNVIFCDSLTAKKEWWIKHAFDDENVEVKDAEKFGIYSQAFSHESTIPVDVEDVPAEINITIGGTSICGIFEYVYYTSGTERVTDEALKANNKIAKYKITSINGEIREETLSSKFDELLYNVTAKEIIAFHTEAVPMYSESNLMEDKILEIAKKDVTDLYGKDFLTKYSYRISANYKELTALGEGGWQYFVVFDRKMGEFEVDEKVMLSYNGNGQLYQILPVNLNAFDGIESKITEKALIDVEEKALKLLDGRLVNRKELQISTNGDIYVYYSYLLNEEDEGYPNKVYGNFRIKINIQ